MASSKQAAPASKSQAVSGKVEPRSQAVSAQPGSTAVSKMDDAPEYIKKDLARGSENVGTEDLVIPRLEIVQALSPCLKKTDGAYIEGIEVGDIFNSVTRENYGKKVAVVPVFFKKEYLVWKDRKKGGGFRGAHQTHEQALARISEQTDDHKDYAVNETAQQFVLVLRESGGIEQAVVSMSRTKLKVSRNWNSLMRIASGDTFSRYYIMMAVEEQNANGDDYYNLQILPGKWTPKVAYEQAEAIYTGISKGTVKVKIDDKYDETGDGAGTPGKTEY